MPDDRVPPPLSNHPDHEEGQGNDKPEEPQSSAKRPLPSPDSRRTDSFSHFVNDQLDLSSLAEPGIRLHAFRFTPTEPTAKHDSDDQDDDKDKQSNSPFHSGLRAMLGGSGDDAEETSIEASLFDDEDDEQDDDGARSMPSFSPGAVFGAGLPFNASRSASSREEAKPTPFSTTRRIPAYNDPRWVKGFYSVARDLELHQPSLFTPRVIVFANAHLRLNRRIEYIRDVAPGYSAVKWHRYGTVIPNVVIGLVKNSDVRLKPATGWRARLVPEIAPLYGGLLSEVLISLAMYAAFTLLVVVVGLLLLNALLPHTTLRTWGVPVLDEDVPVVVETRLSEQQAQIDQLEMTIRTLRGDR